MQNQKSICDTVFKYPFHKIYIIQQQQKVITTDTHKYKQFRSKTTNKLQAYNKL